MRDLFKDTLLMGYKEEKSPAPGRIQTQLPMRALPLCPVGFTLHLAIWRFDIMSFYADVIAPGCVDTTS